MCLCIMSVFASEANDNLMPQGFEKIHLGMDWRTVISLRPKAEITSLAPRTGVDLKPNPDIPKESLMEEPSDIMPYSVMYTFKNGLLVHVLWGKKSEGFSVTERHDLIKRVVNSRGAPQKIHWEGTTPEHGRITWQDAKTKVDVVMPIGKTDTRVTSVGLQIMTLDIWKSVEQFADTAKETEYRQEFEQWKEEVWGIISANTNTKATKVTPFKSQPVPAVPQK